MRSCLPAGDAWRIGAAIAGVSDEHRRWLVEYCHVIWPYLRLRGRPPELRSPQEAESAGAAAADPGSLARITATAAGLLSIST